MRKFFAVFFSAAMLFSAGSAFTQEAWISDWGYGLETSFEATAGDKLFRNYSVSIQGVNDTGYGFSLDWISGVDGTRSLSGLLGSAILGIPVSQYFVPYVGGGLGIKLGDDKFFAWKVDGGVASWLSDILYVKTSVSYDNVRKGLGISVGVGFKFEKNVPAVYRNSDGSTFRRYFSKYLWENNSTPNYVYEDKLVSSEVVKTYQTTQTSTQYIAPRYETRVSGGETVTTEIRENRLGGASWTATTTTPKKVETVQTRDSENRINYYVYNVTVTRKWYTRTFYYKDRAPTTQQIYQDSESAVLVNQFSETM